MKVLYAIQGTGNGHISRATDIIPLLEKKCKIDVMVSGYQSDVEIPFKVDYKYRGLSFIFGKSGGVDVWNTYIKANTKKLREEIKSLPVENYDFVINDFEPVSAWACYKKKVPCLAFSHQSALLNKDVPKPKGNDLFGKFILKNYAPSSMQFGLHFCNYSKNVFTPVIRQDIRHAALSDNGHYTVYLPSYNDEYLLKTLRKIRDVKWQIFSKHDNKVIINKNVEIYPISNDGFVQSMTTATGVLCGAGFETPAEAMFMGKKLMVVPMKTQYEQQCNAAALKGMGVPVIKKLKPKNLERIQNWIDSDYKIEVNYPDITDKIISRIFETHVEDRLQKNHWEKDFNLLYPVEDRPVKSMVVENP